MEGRRQSGAGAVGGGPGGGPLREPREGHGHGGHRGMMHQSSVTSNASSSSSSRRPVVNPNRISQQQQVHGASLSFMLHAMTISTFS